MKAILHYTLLGQIEVVLTERQKAIIAELRMLHPLRGPDSSENRHLDKQIDALQAEFYSSGFEGLPKGAFALRIE